MNTNELKKHSLEMRQQAQSILHSTKLLEILRKFGEVHLIGSYPLDIMYVPDIDIIIETENIKQSSVDALQEIINKELFRKIEYGDFVKFPKQDRPEGYILVLKTVVEQIQWEIEIWFLEDATKQLEYNKSLESNINKDNRIKILEAKHLRNTSDISKYSLSSFEIYEQILFNNKR